MQVSTEIAKAKQKQSPRPLSVLVVEDEAVIARDLERSLSHMGYDVIAAVMSGEEALRVSEHQVPDVVLMDIHIAGERDGIETAAALQRRHQVPIIYLTAYADTETVERAARTAPYGYLVKPFTGRDVRSAIEVARGKYELDRELARRELWFATTLKSIGDAVIACDLDRRVAFMNAAAETLTGWTAAEALGRRVEEVVCLAGDPDTMGRVVTRALEGRGVESIPPLSQLIGRQWPQPRTVSDSASAIVHDDCLLGAVIVLRDSTEEEELRQRATTSERLASLGTLSAGVAHEINNPLTFVVSNLHCLERLIKTRDPALTPEQDARWLAAAREYVGTLREGAERIQQVVADMALFGQQAARPVAPVDPRASIEWALRVTAHQLRHRAGLVVDLGRMPLVRASETELGQVFVNLLVNAAHAIPLGDPSKNFVRVGSRTEDGWAVVTVDDTGAGMSPEVLARIFDPFFTTKAPGRGTGLGLSICHRIVEGLGGKISVTSAPYEGSSFEVRLPEASTPHRELPPPVTRAPAERGRVLVIDDDPVVLRSITRVIGADHDVVSFDMAEEALEHLEHDARFDVVLCNLMMPRIGGEEFLHEVQLRWPRLEPAVVFMSGGAFTQEASSFLETSETTHIQKPLDPAALSRFVMDRVRRRRDSLDRR